jgi:hypothetical protein
MPQTHDMGPPVLLPLRRKACWGFFSPRKIRRLRPGLNPRTWVVEASTHPLDHRSRLHMKLPLHSSISPVCRSSLATSTINDNVYTQRSVLTNVLISISTTIYFLKTIANYSTISYNPLHQLQSCSVTRFSNDVGVNFFLQYQISNRSTTYSIS